MSALEIDLLGSFTVQLNGHRVEAFGTKKVRALLAYLVMEASRPAPRSAMAATFWPEHPEADARRNLRQALHRLRRAIPAKYLLVTSKTIQFDPDSDYKLDAASFAALTLEVHAHRHASLTTCGLCKERLHRAADLYRGDFLMDFFLADSAAFEEWAAIKRAWYRREISQVLARLIAASTEAGSLDRAQEFAWRRVELDPLDEDAQRQLMRTLAWSGQRSAALSQFESFERLLSDELAVGPDQETLGLVEDIRQGEFEREIAAPSQQAGAPRVALPAPSAPFVGRARELAQLQDLLTSPGSRLLIVLAAGGMGKTRLAIEAAKLVGPQFQDGTYFVPVGTARDSADLIRAVTESMGLSYHGTSEPLDQLCGYLKERSVLLLLDGFEHLAGGDVDRAPEQPPQRIVSRLLESAPHLKIMLTSRIALGLLDEQMFPLAGIEVPKPGVASLAAMQSSDAFRLFMQGALRSRPGIELDRPAIEAVAEICRRVQGMPLAILLAAAWVELFGPDEILERIEHEEESGRPLDFYQGRRRSSDPDEAGLRDIFARSWSLLTELERQDCRRVAVFQGGFTSQAAQQVSEVGALGLSNLIRKSFLQREQSSRFGMHELVRKFCIEKLETDTAEAEQIRGRHSRFFCLFLQESGARLKGVEYGRGLQELDADGGNVLLAWDRAVQDGNLPLVDLAMEPLGAYLNWRNRYHEAESRFSQLCERLKSADEASRYDEAARSWTLGRALIWQGEFRRILGGRRTAAESIEEGITLLQRVEDRGASFLAAVAKGRLAQARLALDGGELPEARARYLKALDLYGEAEDQLGRAQSLAGLAEVANRSGEYELAEQRFSQALKIYRSLGNERGAASTLERMGFVCRDQGLLEEAALHTAESLSLYEALDDRAKVAAGTLALGWLLIYQGRFAEAHATLVRSASIHDELGLSAPPGVLAIASAELGRYLEAEAYLREHVRLSRKREDRFELSMGLIAQGVLKVLTADYAASREHLAEAIALCEETHQQDRLAQAYALWGFTARGLGLIREAEESLADSLRMAQELRGFVPLLFALPGAALLLDDRGESERAVEIYASIAELQLIANSQLRSDLAGRRLAEAASKLPQKVRSAARERGRSKGPWEVAAELSLHLAEKGWPGLSEQPAR